MIPPDLLMAIAGTRERVPFPSLIEVLIMELPLNLFVKQDCVCHLQLVQRLELWVH